MSSLTHTRVVILGAAGRDFHNFNVAFRDDPRYHVVAFTAAQLPGIAGRRYPPELAGMRYPEGIPIVPESELEDVCRTHRVGLVVFAYSDVPHETVMHIASRAIACGADFSMLGPDRTMLTARRPVIAVSAMRTGAGKSQVSRYLSRMLRESGRKTAVIRHPMPYGDLLSERAQRFATREDLDAARCTMEEREEYEPHIAAGNVVYAGVDYAEILRRAEREAEILLWEGGNNDFPFVRPTVHIALADPLRAGQETRYHPGESVLRMADIIVVNKTNIATQSDVDSIAASAAQLNPRAALLYGASPVAVEKSDQLRGKRVVVVEDGPSVTHGGMSSGAGYAAALAAGAVIVDPRPYATGEIAETYARYPHLRDVLPAMGYNAAQLDALKKTISQTEADIVVSGTLVDLAALLDLGKPVARARYEYADAGTPTLWQAVSSRLPKTS
jgi:predicted GTPase